MAGVVELRLDGAAAALRALERLSKAVKGGDPVRRVGEELRREALSLLIALTPRQHDPASRTGATSRGYPPVYRGWKSAVVNYARGAVYSAQIRNVIEDDPEGRRILEALEYGARPHEIRPRNAPGLHWTEPGVARNFQGRRRSASGHVTDEFLTRAGGEDVYADRVQHPGHRPFGMLAGTVEQMQHSLGPLGDRLLSEFGRIWEDNFQASVSESL